MGPRLKDVEDPPVAWSVRKSCMCFNGATSQGRGRRFRGSAIGGREPSFNGATSQGRGRHVGKQKKTVAGAALQWGHVSRTWKTWLLLFGGIGYAVLQWGHVSRTWKTTMTGCGTCRRAGFNGATSQGRGRPVRVLRFVRVPNGFNGATSQGRGRRRPRIRGSRSTRRFNGATSQGRGRHERRGKGQSIRWLQWGHVSRTWKTGRGSRAIRSALVSFNGATSQGRGRRCSSAGSVTRQPLLQWGHVSRTWKTPPSDAVACVRAGCFNGATSQGRGRLCWPRQCSGGSSRFNGATSQGRGRQTTFN